ncbi:TPA: hypothetical protein SLO06_003528, partial [Proteus mirabilis]|nr:hypothetical protein [Proteus mirabilis]
VLETPKYEINALETIFTGNVTVNGNYAVNGNSDSNGGTMKHNGKDIGSTHQHSGVETGHGNTGAPL